ncbi:hypothetical protein D1164_04505 [Mariniphaga sediminis]|uniref:Uncharacterized protein n=1 Tax=Mariniphaga sediminis TaxID=1628158 RepID=A0A399D3N5_9BACT|nr:hypothetical protein [Mariniphaga sediminis]RIH66177.1 hypothetical protein D1164_04505 [Mariniphaga sediminis]
MKTIKFTNKNLESILSENCIFRTTDGRNHAVFHAESGSATENIITALNKNGITFYFENYLDEYEEIDEDNGETKTVEGEQVKFSKFVIRIDDLKDVCIDLFIELKLKEKISKKVWQGLVENNKINDVFFS